MNDRITQLVALLVLAGGLIAAMLLSPGIKQQRLDRQLTYATVAGDDANVQYTLLASTGSLRGIMINAAWYRIEKLKNEGKFAEANDLARFIVSLQPRFPQAWEFMAWNMAYNISVKCNTQEERWYWVNNGINLVRNEGIPNNARSILLYKQLSWILSHKMGGRTDDMHWYYKRQFAEEWEELLGAPSTFRELSAEAPRAPRNQWHELTPDQFDWHAVGQFRDLNDMAQTYFRREADRDGIEWTPDHYFTALSPDAKKRFFEAYPQMEPVLRDLRGLRGQAGEDLGLGLNTKTLNAFGRITMLQRAGYNLEDERLRTREVLGEEALAVFNYIAERNAAGEPTAERPRLYNDPSPRSGRDTTAQSQDPTQLNLDPLMDLLRAQALIADYHMDPAYMLWLMEEYGPMDWRHTMSHALYWSSLGTLMAEGLVNKDRVDVINNDRQTIHAIQGLTYNGTLIFRPQVDVLGESGEGIIFTMADPRFIPAYDRALTRTRERIASGEFGNLNTNTYDTGYENFLHSAVVLSWYGGQTGLARQYYDQVREEFGGENSTSVYAVDYEVYDLPTFAHVRLIDDDLYDSKNSHLMQMLRRAWYEGMVQREPLITVRLIRSAKQFYDEIAEEYDSVANAGTDTQGRMAMEEFGVLLVETFVPVITDPTYSLQERAGMWTVAAQLMPDTETLYTAYNRMYGPLAMQLQTQGYDVPVTDVFPVPRGFPEWLEQRRQEEEARDGTTGPGILRQ